MGKKEGRTPYGRIQYPLDAPPPPKLPPPPLTFPGEEDLLLEVPSLLGALKNKDFRSKSRHTKNFTAGIWLIFRG
jgi:hypothetical protein